jgi:hypothetical protein
LIGKKDCFHLTPDIINPPLCAVTLLRRWKSTVPERFVQKGGRIWQLYNVKSKRFRDQKVGKFKLSQTPSFIAKILELPTPAKYTCIIFIN